MFITLVTLIIYSVSNKCKTLYIVLFSTFYSIALTVTLNTKAAFGGIFEPAGGLAP